MAICARFSWFSPLAFSLAPAQPSPPAQHQSIVVTGAYDPVSLDEADRSLTVLPPRNLSLLLDNLGGCPPDRSTPFRAGGLEWVMRK